MNCKICGNKLDNTAFVVREMTLGLRDEFTYLYCKKCECLQIGQLPLNIEKYYPANYYSFSNTNKKHSKWKQYFARRRDLCVIEGGKNYLGRIINSIKPAGSLINILSHTNITRVSRILDVGTGYGSKMQPLINAGYNVTGIDPFIKENEVNINGLRIFKKEIDNIEAQWDLIMLNHVFEHLSDPQHVLIKITKLLSREGKCLIRTPIIPSYAWEKYKTNWVQIDAPRHFFIHSKSSLQLMADKANLRIEKIIYDSIPFQFLGSELYKRDIASKEGDFRLNSSNRLFTPKEISHFIKKTTELNMKGNGDQAAFILSKLK